MQSAKEMFWRSETDLARAVAIVRFAPPRRRAAAADGRDDCPLVGWRAVAPVNPAHAQQGRDKFLASLDRTLALSAEPRNL